MMPTSTEIRYFLELYPVRHFTKAASILGVTQSTLTQSIHRLEARLGDKLFFRTKQGCVPTRSGELFYGKAKELLSKWEETSSLINDNLTTLSGRFRVGCHPCVGAYTLPRLFKELTVNAPDIKLDLSHDYSRKITEKVISYELDLAFVINPVRHRDLVLKQLARDVIRFWKRKGAKKVPKRIFTDLSIEELYGYFGKGKVKTIEDWQIVSSTSLELVRTLTVTWA